MSNENNYFELMALKEVLQAVELRVVSGFLHTAFSLVFKSQHCGK